ncbi:MAG: acyl carrier protein [Deltaproteobacteria bacterium]|nr:acyl carrier protein [Deltaproteobacteria bacterium]
MTSKEIEDRLVQGIASITSRDKSSIAVDMPFHKLGIDSLGFVEALVFIEKAFKLQLIETDLTKKDFETIHSLAAFISKRL